MSDESINFIVTKAETYGFEVSKDSEGKWIITLPTNIKKSLQIKQTENSNEWLILLNGQAQMYFSTEQVSGILEIYSSKLHDHIYDFEKLF